jgi:hypothetical protein
MRKLLAAVAISALALTSAVPMAQAAQSAVGVHKVEKQNVHKVATKKKAKTTKSSKKKAPMKSS